MTRGRAVVCWQQQKQVMAVLMMPILVCLSDGDLLHTKAGSERTAGAKTGLHSLLLVVKRTRSAVQSTPITAIQNYQKHTDERAQAAVNSARVRLMLLGVLGWWEKGRASSEGATSSRTTIRPWLIAGNHGSGPFWTSLGASRLRLAP
jgi:hypothetical protein